MANQTKAQGIQIIDGIIDPRFDNPAPGIFTSAVTISGCAWVETSEGAVLIDTHNMNNLAPAQKTLEKIHAQGLKVVYIIYTHGHLDHVGGSQVFLADGPKEILANKHLPDRLEKYEILSQHNIRINAQQFNMSEEAMVEQLGQVKLVRPTRLITQPETLSVGGKTFELHPTRAETDDVLWIWHPEARAAFIGDLLIGSFPNIGNPWKPTRFALDWARALEEVLAKRPEIIFYNGAAVHLKGEEAREALEVSARAIRSLHDQVVDLINQDVHLSEMIHMVKLPDDIKDHPRLQFKYSRPEFFVQNVYRWYHGHFDHNPAHLIPRPEKETAAALMALIGDEAKVIEQARAYLENGQAQLGLEVLDVLLKSRPENKAAIELSIELMEALAAEDYCLMSKNAMVHFIEKARKRLA